MDGMANRRRAAEPEKAVASRRPSPVREAQKALTRSLLTEAAQRVFEARGYVNVSVDDIAREAGSSRATFYLHFESKAAVLAEVLHRSRRRTDLRELLQRGYVAFQSQESAESPEVIALTEAWFADYVDFYLRHRDLQRVVHHAQVVEPAFARRQLQDVRRNVELWQSAGFVRDIPPEELRLQAIMLFALLDTTMHLWLEDDIAIDRDTAVRGLARIFRRTVWPRRDTE